MLEPVKETTTTSNIVRGRKGEFILCHSATRAAVEGRKLKVSLLCFLQLAFCPVSSLSHLSTFPNLMPSKKPKSFILAN